MPPVKCPYCGREHQTRPHINILCPCGAKYYIHTREWWGRGGAAVAMTNADRIRAMSDEELARWLNLNADKDFSYEHCCTAEWRKKPCNNKCVACLADWLQQPCEGGADK